MKNSTCKALMLVGMICIGGCQLQTSAETNPIQIDVISADDKLNSLTLTADDYKPALERQSRDQLETLRDNREQMQEFVLDWHSDVALLRYAEKKGLDRDPAVRRDIETSRAKILIKALLDDVALKADLPEYKILEQLAYERYLNNINEFSSPERRKVAHILIQADGDEGQQQAQIDQIIQKLGAGENFADLAQQHSEDLTSKEQGGVIDYWIAPDGKFVPEFETAVFKIEFVGDISPTVRTRYGLHLIELLDIEPRLTTPFEEVKTDLIEEERNRIRQSAVEMLRSKAYPDVSSIGRAPLLNLIDALISDMEKREEK